MANSGTQLLLYTNMPVNMNGGKTTAEHDDGLQHSQWQFSKFYCAKQSFFIYEVGKFPKHGGSESLPLLSHCRDAVSQKYQNFKNRGRLRYRSYSNTCTCITLRNITKDFLLCNFLFLLACSLKNLKRAKATNKPGTHSLNC